MADTTIKYPDITVQLTGTDGNAYSIMGKVTRAMRRAGVPAAEIEAFKEEARSGTYDNLIQTAMKWVNVE